MGGHVRINEIYNNEQDRKFDRIILYAASLVFNVS